MNMAYTPKGSRTGWVQQPMAWWGVAAHGGQGLWSLVGPGLALAIPTCSRWWGWSSPWPPSCPEAGGAHSAAESWDNAMDGPWGDTWCSYGGLSPSHLETSHCKPPCGSIFIYGIHQAWWDTDANHPALPLWGQNRGAGTGAGGDPHNAAGASTFHLVPPWSSSPDAPRAQTGLHSSCCNTEGLASHHHRRIHGSCKPLLSLQTWSWPGALSLPWGGTGGGTWVSSEGLLHKFSVSLLVMPQPSTVGLVILHHQAPVSPPCNISHFPT